MLEIANVETHKVEGQENRMYFAEDTPAPKVRHCRRKTMIFELKI